MRILPKQTKIKAYSKGHKRLFIVCQCGAFHVQKEISQNIEFQVSVFFGLT